jgi:LytS/YehU family sensor histidine kinase
MWTLVDSALWLLLGIPLLAVCRLAPLDRIRWPAGLCLHLLGAGMFSMAHVALSALLREQPVQPVFDARFHWNMVIYWAIAAASHAWIYHRNLESNQRRSLELEARLAEAELHALKMQLHPHFLFNTLETISALMYRDVDAADRMIAQLGDLLRHTLRHSHVHQVTLREELDFLTRYLEIEQTRFQDRLRVRLDVDPSVLDASVPNLILQPLVENAIRHGVAPRASAGQVDIFARRSGETLFIEIRDDGEGPRSGSGERVGLTNTRRRLEQIYGRNGLFELCTGERGTVASLTLPLSPVKQ